MSKFPAPSVVHHAASHVLMAAGVVLPALLSAQSVDPDALRQLEFRHIGPVGNRVSSVVGVAGDPLTYYAGAATGGVWKSTDGGEYWDPVFDGYPDHAIGALAVAPSDPEIVWAGAGEPHIRSNVSVGTGVWKSTDGGKSWQHMGLGDDGPTRTSRIVIHPTNPDIVYVGALGHAHGPQGQRGIFRTVDGGETWEHVLFADENTGASSLEMDPNNPRILFAGMWTVVFNTWGRESGGPGSGIYMSRDAGTTWTKLEGNGLPTKPVGKVDICMTRADSDRIYALIETGDGVPWHGQETDSGELWRSDDGGSSWELMTHSRDFGGRTAYYNQCVVAPDDPDTAYFMTSGFLKSIDGGRTGTMATGRSRPRGDNHDMWIDPTNPRRMVVANDGGLDISVSGGASWHRVELPLAQMYHVTVDNAIPYNVLGNRQDGPSFRGPSNSRTTGNRGGTIQRGMWNMVGGGESGFATPDPEDPNIVWSSASGSGARGGIVVRFDQRNRQYRQVEVWPEQASGHPAGELRYRFQWTFPLLISPHDRNTIYVTSQHVHRTTNGGQSWDVISPDLTTNDESKQGISGGLTPDNIGVEYCCVIYAFDESPVQQGVFWAGSNDGLVHVSQDGGDSWTNVTANIPDLPPDGVVRNIDASRYEAGKAYVAIEHHQQGNFDPHVYRTADFGASWTKIVTGIADSPLSYARSIHEDPVRPGLLYLGTENTLYFSLNDGDTWQSLHGANLPHSPMYWLVVQEHFNDLVVGTYGRGFWILDDITALRQLTSEVMASESHLFDPRDAYRFRPVTTQFPMTNDPSDGEDPEFGASLNYWLGSPHPDGVTLRISDASGTAVRTIKGPGEVGINRVWWDLEDEASTSIRLRTAPLYADWVDLGPDGWRSGGQGISILVAPGTYTVSLEVGGQEQSTQVTVLKDPNSEGTQADILAQTAMVSELREDYEVVASMVNRIEWIRRQLYDLAPVLEDRGNQDAVLSAMDELDQKLIAAEHNLVRLTTTGTGQDGVRWSPKLADEIRYLAGAVATADFQPTDQMGEVQQLLKDKLERFRIEVETVLDTDVPAFNRSLQERNLPPLISDR